jgi:hypothetical protein
MYEYPYYVQTDRPRFATTFVTTITNMVSSSLSVASHQLTRCRYRQGYLSSLPLNDFENASKVANTVYFRCFSDKKKTAKVDDGPKVKQAKVKKKEKPKKDDDNARSKELNLILAALDAPIRKEPPISEEEKARRHEIGRNYNIGRFRFHNEIQQDLAQKINLKKHAIKMLPRNSRIKDEALKESDETPQPWRKVPVWTPPIPGFDPSKYLTKDD